MENLSSLNFSLPVGDKDPMDIRKTHPHFIWIIPVNRVMTCHKLDRFLKNSLILGNWLAWVFKKVICLIPREDTMILNKNFLIENFSKLDHGVRKVLFGEGKIKLARWRRAEWTGRPKNVKFLTSKSISEITRFDQSVSFTCKIFQFKDFFEKIPDFKFTPNPSQLGDQYMNIGFQILERASR